MQSVTALIVLCICVIKTSGRFSYGSSYSGSRSDLSYNASCIDPNMAGGRCVLVRECQIVLLTIRKETLSPADISYLYRSECGKLERKSLVCCPHHSIVVEHSEVSQPPGDSASFNAVNRVDQVESSSTGAGGSKLNQWNLLPPPGECGTQPSYQLFGENVTKLDEQPWTALVHFGNKPYETTFECGGALISTRYVLTAAHCVSDGTKWTNLTVRLGEWDTESTVDCISIEDYNEFYCADPALDITVEKVYIHEEYIRGSNPEMNDIALLRLSESVSPSNWIRPVCLPQGGMASKNANQIFTLAGWGNNGCGFNSRFKIRSKLNALSDDQCKEKIQLEPAQASDFLCTVPLNEGEKCHADSGGAVTTMRQIAGVGVIHEVRGILNHMKECSENRPLGVFSNIEKYINWIVSKLEK